MLGLISSGCRTGTAATADTVKVKTQIARTSSCTQDILTGTNRTAVSGAGATCKDPPFRVELQITLYKEKFSGKAVHIFVTNLRVQYTLGKQLLYETAHQRTNRIPQHKYPPLISPSGDTATAQLWVGTGRLFTRERQLAAFRYQAKLRGSAQVCLIAKRDRNMESEGDLSASARRAAPVAAASSESDVHPSMQGLHSRSNNAHYPSVPSDTAASTRDAGNKSPIVDDDVPPLETDGNSRFICNICLNSPDKPVATYCSVAPISADQGVIVVSCSWKCLYKWLDMHRDEPQCPVCKAGIEMPGGDPSKAKVVPLYVSEKDTDPRCDTSRRLLCPPTIGC
eukprot:1474010-Rhodomonas_salina.1